MSNSDTMIIGFYLIFAVMAFWAFIQAWVHQARTETIHPFKAFVHLLAFYLSYLLVPLWFFSIFAGWAGYYSLHQAAKILKNQSGTNK